MATVTATRNGLFPRLAVSHEAAANKLTTSYNELSSLGAVGQDVAKRIQNVGENIATFTLPEIHSYIDLSANTLLIERNTARQLQFVNLIRNILILLPLALTWFALQQATILYQADIVANPQDVNVPFLDLWQSGFGNPSQPLTFSHVAAADLTLYGLLIVVGIFADNIVRRSQTRARRLQQLITEATDELNSVAISLSSNTGSNTTDVSRWMTQIQSVLTDATNLVRQVGQQMTAFQASATALGDSAASLGVSAASIGTSANQLATEARNLTTSVQGISGAATQMANAAGSMTEASRQISGEVQGFNRAMTAAFDHLSQAQQTHSAQLQTEVGRLTQSQQQNNTRLQELTTAVGSVSNHASRSADALTGSVRDHGRIMREAGLAQRGLVNKMQGIHREQQRMQAELGGRGTGFWSILFGFGRNAADTRDWTAADDQDSPVGPPPAAN